MSSIHHIFLRHFTCRSDKFSEHDFSQLIRLSEQLTFLECKELYANVSY